MITDSVAGKYIKWVTVAAYRFCGVRPYQVGNITPMDLLIMLSVKIPEEIPGIQGQKDISQGMEPMDDNTMELMITNVLHPVITAIASQGDRNG